MLKRLSWIGVNQIEYLKYKKDSQINYYLFTHLYVITSTSTCNICKGEKKIKLIKIIN